MRRLRELLGTGRGAMALAAGWNLFDALLHLAIGMVEPLRLSGNLVAVLVAVIVRFVPSGRIAALVGAAGLGTTIGLVLGVAGGEGGLLRPAIVLIGVGLLLLALGTYRFAAAGAPDETQPRHGIVTGAVALALAVGLAVVVTPRSLQSSIQAQAFDDRLVDADYWTDQPKILSAGMGFDGIIGIPSLDEQTVREYGGAWIGDPDCAEPPESGGLTSAATPQQLALTYRGPVEGDDGLPIVFSWPVLGETAHVDDFHFTTNTGETVFADTVGMWPNWELNERNTVVVFADLGNRGQADDPEAVFPVRLEIVDDGTPLTLVGPDGPVSAVGLAFETNTTRYDVGPELVGAKLNRVSDGPSGEGGVGAWEGLGMLPNDEFALYGGGDFRLRVLTSGGFSPDGATPVTPDTYEDHFRIHATRADGETVLLEDVQRALRGRRQDPRSGRHVRPRTAGR
jgi:hypothetical protein